jgi:hypothetical protein
MAHMWFSLIYSVILQCLLSLTIGSTMYQALWWADMSVIGDTTMQLTFQLETQHQIYLTLPIKSVKTEAETQLLNKGSLNQYWGIFSS